MTIAFRLAVNGVWEDGLLRIAKSVLLLSALEFQKFDGARSALELLAALFFRSY